MFASVIGLLEVVHAVALRETRTRFGAHQMGYLWALLEPALMILTFLAIFLVVNRSIPAGMDVFGFVATGIIPYALFSNSVSRVAESINGNKALLFYPRVHPIDLAIARASLELATFGGVFLVLMGCQVLYCQSLDIHSSLMIVEGWFLAGALGSTLGLIFCGLGQFSNMIDRARGPLLRPLFWVSGIFFAGDELPAFVKEYFFLNPVLHCVELVRGGWYPSYAADDARPSYVVCWVLCFLLAGLVLERMMRRRVQVT